MAHQPQPHLETTEQPSSSVVGLAHKHATWYISNEAYTAIMGPGEVGEVCIGGPQVGRGFVRLFL